MLKGISKGYAFVNPKRNEVVKLQSNTIQLKGSAIGGTGEQTHSASLSQRKAIISDNT